MAKEGWAFFKAIETEGGYIAALKSNWLQNQIQAKAEAEQASFNAGELKLIGVNVFRNAEEQFSETLKSALEPKTEESNSTEVQKIRANRLAEDLERSIILENSAS